MIKSIVKRVSLILLLLHFAGINAIEPQIKFKHLKVENGLSQSWVKSIYQDQQGFMWFGTNDGLNKYNGYDFTVYKHSNEDEFSLTNNSIEAIYEDKNNNLWIGTESGLNLYDRNKDRFIHYDSWPLDEILDIFELEYGRLLLATSNSNLFLFNPKKNSFIQCIPDQNNPFASGSYTIDCVLRDKQGTIWLGTTIGLNRLDTLHHSFSYFNIDHNNNKTTVDIRTLLLDKKGNIWFGTRDKGLYVLIPAENGADKYKILNYQHNPEDKFSITHGTILSLWEDNMGYLWIGTENGGLAILDLNQWQQDNCVFYNYRHNQFDNSSLSYNSVYSIYGDRNGSIWIGTYGDGINVYNRLIRKFIHYENDPNNSNSLSNNFVNVFYEDNASNLWIGTDAGLSMFDRKENIFKYYTYDPDENPETGTFGTFAILKDSKGNLWSGTWAGGLKLYNKTDDTFTCFKHNPDDNRSIGSNNVFSIVEDHDGNLWIGTMGGGLNLFDYQKKSFKKYVNDGTTSRNSISDNWIRMVFENSNGEIWISTGGTIELFDKENGTFTHFKHDKNNEKSISDNSANLFFEDSKKNLWIGTNCGLSVFNREDSSFISYYEYDGLPNNQIQGILEDDHGNLWLSTNKGISKFIRGIHKPEHPKFMNYNIGDGLQGNEFRARSCWKGQDGRMYFGGKNGFNVFHPDSIRINTQIPPILITRLLLFNKNIGIGTKDSPLKKHISLTKDITLSYKHSVITFKYAALNFIVPEKNQYAYKLEGFEKYWNPVGNKREATYTNLDPGDYIFRVKGSNNDNIWNDEGTSLHITITPPFWKTLWFRIFMILFVVIIIYTVYRIRIRNIEANRRELEVKVEERTHELKQATREISKKAAELHKSKLNLEHAKKETDNILDNVEEGLFLLNKQYEISSQYSSALEVIFSTKKIAQVNLLDFLKNKIPDSEIENMKTYLTILYDDQVNEDSVKHLNPLIGIEFTFPPKKDKYSLIKKYLNFNFKRITADDQKIVELIVTVRDVTRQILLSKQLKQEEERREKLLQLMLSILDVEPDMLSDFSESAERELEFIDKIINHDKIDNYHDLLVKAFRSMHLIKGNAKLLNIEYFAQTAHQFEDMISAIQKKSKISEKDIDPLREKLRELQTGIEEMEQIIERMGKVLTHKGAKRKADTRSLLRSLENLIIDFSNDINKKIKFNYKNFKTDLIPAKYHLLVKEVLIQLVRNSISHGIETPEERKKVKKPQYGIIEISTFKKNGIIGIRLRDDGRGIQIEKLKEKALQSGKWEADEINKWNDQEIADLIFTSGISTSDKIDMVAGRGVGMDGVIYRLKEYNGEIQIHHVRGQFCQFDITLPAEI